MFLSDLIFSRVKNMVIFLLHVYLLWNLWTDHRYFLFNFILIVIVTYWQYDSTIRTSKLENKPLESLNYFKGTSLWVKHETGFSFPGMILSIEPVSVYVSQKSFFCFYFKLRSKRKVKIFVQYMFFQAFFLTMPSCLRSIYSYIETKKMASCEVYKVTF